MEQQLEECDVAENDQLMGSAENEDTFVMLRRLDGDLHEATHKSYINDNKFLFDVRLNPSLPPALCLRHDVDGILWQPHPLTKSIDIESAWLSHVNTFLAFGYVQASKQNTKFRLCSPDCSYVCIADTNKHIYVYKSLVQNSMDTQLKNRKTGKLISHVAKQYLISLESDDEIYGLYCANDYLVVLLSEVCYLFKINSN